MKQLLIEMILGSIKQYEEKLEELKLEKAETYKDAKKVERLKKLVEKANIDGVSLDIPENETSIDDLGEIEESIKIVKSTLRRLYSVAKMYDIEVVDSLEDEQE